MTALSTPSILFCSDPLGPARVDSHFAEQVGDLPPTVPLSLLAAALLAAALLAAALLGAALLGAA